MITTHVPEIAAMQPPDAETNHSPHKIWMTLMHVLKITVFLTEELFTNQSLVTTKINASNPNVILLRDVYSLELTVTITTHVPLTNVFKEYVSTLL